jgi:hypothetical protein
LLYASRNAVRTILEDDAITYMQRVYVLTDLNDLSHYLVTRIATAMSR